MFFLADSRKFCDGIRIEFSSPDGRSAAVDG
jgi:hypothetical protein